MNERKTLAIMATAPLGMAMAAAGALNAHLGGPAEAGTALAAAAIPTVSAPGALAAASQVRRVWRTVRRMPNPGEDAMTNTAMAGYLTAITMMLPVVAIATMAGYPGTGPAAAYLAATPIAALAAWMAARRARRTAREQEGECHG